MKYARMLLLGSGMACLVGCIEPDVSDLRAYVNEVKSRPRGKVDPIPTFPPYEPFTYTAASLRSPFLPPDKVELALEREESQAVRPDETRLKEHLENFSIDEFRMVGTLEKDQRIYALLRGANGVHRVKIGDYLGRNHGRIIKIDRGQIEVVEIVPDGEGGWLERPRILSLQERS